MTLSPTSPAANAAVTDQAYALISSDPRLAIAIADLAHATGYPATIQAARPMADLYVHLTRIWSTKNGTKPFHLKGKDGLWKQVDQQYLADGLNWCLRTVSRNLNKLERVGLIRYERQGYISSKYLQLVSIEQARGSAAVAQCQTSGSDPSPHDTALSDTYRTRCLVGNGQGVRWAKDTVSDANTEKLHRESIDTEDLELSPQHSCEPTGRGEGSSRKTEQPLRTDKALMVADAIAHYDRLQADCGGVGSDAGTYGVLFSLVQGLSDDDAAEALGTALARGYTYWSGDEPCPHDAEQLAAGLRDQWRELGPNDQTPNAPSCVLWDPVAKTFDFDLIGTYDPEQRRFRVALPQRPVEPPQRPVQTLTEPSPVNSQPQPAPLAANIINLVPETRESQPKRAAANDIAGQIAQIKALGIQISKPSTPQHPLDDDGGVGEHSDLWQRPRHLVAVSDLAAQEGFA